MLNILLLTYLLTYYFVDANRNMVNILLLTYLLTYYFVDANRNMDVSQNDFFPTVYL